MKHAKPLREAGPQLAPQHVSPNSVYQLLSTWSATQQAMLVLKNEDAFTLFISVLNGPKFGSK